MTSQDCHNTQCVPCQKGTTTNKCSSGTECWSKSDGVCYHYPGDETSTECYCCEPPPPLMLEVNQCKGMTVGTVHYPLAQADCKAWMELYDSTNGANWNSCKSGRNDPCSCVFASAAVNCVVSGDESRIYFIYLDSNNLIGKLPASLAGMQELSAFVVTRNDLRGPGPEFPSAFWDNADTNHCQLPTTFNCPLPPDLYNYSGGLGCNVNDHTGNSIPMTANDCVQKQPLTISAPPSLPAMTTLDITIPNSLWSVQLEMSNVTSLQNLSSYVYCNGQQKDVVAMGWNGRRGTCPETGQVAPKPTIFYNGTALPYPKVKQWKSWQIVGFESENPGFLQFAADCQHVDSHLNPITEPDPITYLTIDFYGHEVDFFANSFGTKCPCFANKSTHTNVVFSIQD